MNFALCAALFQSTGSAALGYDVIDRKLVVNQTETAWVREIFTEYLRLQSVTKLLPQLQAKGIHHYGELYDGQHEAISLTRDEALELLAKDVIIAERAVLRLITVPLNTGQFDALVSFTFNLGAGALQRSTLRRKINREDHADAPAEFRKWVWAGGSKLNGLVKRRKAEAEMYSGNTTISRFAA